MERRRRRMVRLCALVAGALWVAFLISTATPPEGGEEVDAGVDGIAVLLQVLALVVTVVTVGLAARPGTKQPEDDTADRPAG